eukprot:scaffold292615_cov20-Prasinocladus_malaysianus.AAC.1
MRSHLIRRKLFVRSAEGGRRMSRNLRPPAWHNAPGSADQLGRINLGGERANGESPREARSFVSAAFFVLSVGCWAGSGRG